MKKTAAIVFAGFLAAGLYGPGAINALASQDTEEKGEITQEEVIQEDADLNALQEDEKMNAVEENAVPEESGQDNPDEKHQHDHK